MAHHFTGLFVWDCCYHRVASGMFHDNSAVPGTVTLDTERAERER